MNELTPPLDRFTSHYQAGRSQVVWIDLIADLETPVASYLKLAAMAPNSFLLESVEDGDIKGRYSVIGLDPDLIFRVRDGKTSICRDVKRGVYDAVDAQPLEALRQVLAESAIELDANIPSMAAGIFGYLSYDMVKQMENLPDNNPRALDVPDCLLIRPTLIAVFDTVTDTLKLVTPVRPASHVDAQTAYKEARTRLLEARLRLDTSVENTSVAINAGELTISSNMSQADYFAIVDRARDYITAGDIFQVVLSQRFQAPFPLPPFSLYRALRRVNPSPYLFFLNFEGFSVVGSSPEVLVGVQNRIVNIRPIAGTRRRGETHEDDQRIGADLLADEKERAEHLMLLDLGRNDVGRVSELSSVKVNQAFGLQKTSHLIHIVSDVTGTLRQDLDVIDALQAGFPAGTVSGAPKIRAMEIIDELEVDKRGIYAGCVGYFSAGGDMDSCIALRTAIVKDDMLYVQAGGGVVFDSTPQYEYDETVNKAKALFRAAEEAFAIAQDRRNKRP